MKIHHAGCREALQLLGLLPVAERETARLARDLFAANRGVVGGKAARRIAE